MLAAHRTEREPGQLPREGVVLIAVDLEFQRRMAEGILPAPPERVPEESALNFGAPIFGPPTNSGSDRPIIGAANIGALNISAPVIDVISGASQPRDPTIGASNLGASNISAPILEAPNNRALTIGAPEFDVRDLLVRNSGAKTYTVHPLARVEDAFTASERDLLRWLWERGRPVPTPLEIRLVTGPNGEGSRRLAAQAGLIYNTFKNLTRSLSTKLALDIVKPERNLPAVYAVYPYSTIGDRQKRAGFTGVVHKNGGGRELVNGQAQPATRRRDLSIDELQQVLGEQNPGCTKI